MKEKIPIPEQYIRTQSIYRALNQNGDNGLIGAGFIHYDNNREHREELKFNKYSGLLLLQGSGRYWDDTGFTCKLEPGCFIHRFPDRVHCTEIVPDSKWVESYIVLGTPLFNGLVATNIISQTRPVQHPGVQLGIAENIYSMIDEMRVAHDTELTGFIPRIIDILVQVNKFDRDNNLYSHYSDIIEKVTGVLSSDLDKRIDVKNIVKDYPISYDRFRYIFKQETGVSPGVYRIHKKLEKARELLTSHQYKVYEVAQMLGYPDAYSFSKQFSRFVGMSPKGYTRAM